MKTKMKTIEKFLTTTIRSLTRIPDLKPKIKISTSRQNIDIDIDLGDIEIRVLIGARGSMKYAVQTLVAHYYEMDPSDVVVFYRSSCMIPITKNTVTSEPDPDQMRELIDSFLDMVPEATGSELETSKSMVIGKMAMPTDILRDLGYHMTRIFRAAASSNGFQGTLYLSRQE